MNNLFLKSALEQFNILPLLKIQLITLNISITNSTIYFLITVLLIICLYTFCIYSIAIIPTSWQYFTETVYSFLITILREQTGYRGNKYFPILFLIFNFILFSNLIGLLPLSFTTTAHIIVTVTIALSLNLALVFVGFENYGFKFFKLFFPKGVPTILVPLVIVIEIASYLLRTLSLSIRLFANIIAGHTLLFILSSFGLAFLKSNKIISLAAFIPLVILIFAVLVLELGIAMLQAYVFCILFCIYLNDSVNISH